MIELFKRRRKDEVFGEIRFGRTFGIIGAGFWDGQVEFLPLEKQVKVRVASGVSGPTQAQREFFIELENRYINIAGHIREVLLKTPLKYFGSDFFGKLMPELDWRDFELDAVGIEKIQSSQHRWSLSFCHAPMTVSYSVNFDGWTPIQGELDD
ncbi:MAG TPA: hypothetical protein VJL58_05760 [Pyrinomonadaceae bacterium]|nr:hypothetical protein [Pyrinomonadaceae bacterium]